ncbi:MFS transporter [Streptomyces prunicolor]|uniref:MFS transporter n=1 Tax=Streptomyces prunicolor TaxID=67348 RepID=UPI00224FA650|nr:MFS transporter [Streptomyces prunicolor]MCX5238914.1 MFS transporter [Streptomyces prunicolor]
MRSRVGPRHARRPVPTLLRGIYLPRSTDAAASAMATYGIPLLVLATTDSAALTGLAFALEWVPRLGAFAFAGTLVDRHGTTAVLRWASVGRALVVLAAAFILPTQAAGYGTTVTVMLLAASTGILTECSYLAAETAGGIAGREAGERAHRVQPVLLGIDQVATLGGPALAGLLLQQADAAGMLFVIAVFSLLTSLLAPRQRHQGKPSVPQPVLTGLHTGWSTLRELPALGWLVAGLTISNLTVGLLQAATPVIVVKQLGHSPADVGFIWSAAAVASLLAVVLCRRAIERFGLWTIGAVSATIAALACMAVSFTDTYGTYLALIAVLMAGEGGLTVVLRTLRSRLIPAPVFGATLALTILLLLLPFPLAGVLVAAVPPAQLGHVITLCAALQALGLFAAFARLRTAPALRTSFA